MFDRGVHGEPSTACTRRGAEPDGVRSNGGPLILRRRDGERVPGGSICFW